jgi:hypothetical protein
MIPPHICSMCIKTNQVGKQETGMWRVQKRFPRYRVPIWSLWPNIRFLPSIDDEKNVHKNQLSRQTGSRNRTGPKTLPTIWHTYMKLVTKYHIPVINSCLELCDEKCAYMLNVYNSQLSRQTGIWRVQKHFPQYCEPIWRLWRNIRFLPSIVAERKWAYMFNVYKNQQSRQTGSRNMMGPKTLPTIWGTYMKLVTKYQISAINSCWEKCIYVQCI